MADDFSPNASNPFDELYDQGSHNPALTYKSTPDPANDNPYDTLYNGPVTPESSTVGAFARGAERGVVPAAGGLVGAGAGAEAGAAIGGLIGAPFGGVGAGPGALAGGIIGGVAGAFGGSYAADKAQDYALSKAPDSWKESIGQDDRQQRLDAEQHPYASFLGGIAPYALTMRPGGFGAAAKALPENATALQRILANPVTARVFGGALMGGVELGQEATSGESPDWAKIAISTGFGLVFNKPTRLGEAIERAVPRLFRGAPGEIAAPRPLEEQEGIIPQPDLSAFEGLHEPTVAQAGEYGVMGAGFTEDTFFGWAVPDQAAWETAQDTVRTENQLFREPRPPDLDAIARRAEPELFGQYDALNAQRETFRDQIARLSNPPDEDIEAAQQRAAALQTQIDQHLAERGGYAGGPEARRLRAQLREAQAVETDLQNRRQTFAAGEGVETPELAAARQQFQAVDFQLRDMGREIAAARRRAADAVGAETVEPEPIPPMREAVAPEPISANVEASPVVRPAQKASLTPASEAAGSLAGESPSLIETATAPRTIEQQRGAIEADVRSKLLAAGRPADEAEASAKLTSALYETHAERMKGESGTAEEIYRREAPDIRAGRQRAKEPELAQGAELHQADMRAANDDVNPRQGFFDERSDERLTSMVASNKEYIRQQQEHIKRAEDIQSGKEKGVEALHDTALASELRDRRELVASTMKDTIAYEKELLRRERTRTLNQISRGKIRFTDGRSILTLMRDANASTYVHEIGHDWLERLLRDAENPAATDGVKADAAAARKWAGFSEDKPTVQQTKPHEKFARGFEQYLREGVAPSKRLASVFAKFRNWLTEIYQTIKGLGSPINEDIRGVFDRMLSTEPQRTTLQPERSGGPSLADIHLADAVEVEPREADAAADRVDAEREQAAIEPPGEIAHEIAEAESQFEVAASGEGDGRAGTDSTGEAGGGDQRLPEVEHDRSQAGSQPPGGGVGGGPGAQRPSVGAASAESDRVSRSGPEPGGSKSQPLAPNPARLYDSTETKFVDKAGNIRLDNVNAPEDIKQAVRDMAKANNDFIGDRRGKITDGQVLAMAEEMGTDVTRLLTRKLGEAFNAEEIKYAQRLLVDSTNATVVAMKKLSESQSDEDAIAYAAAKSRQQMIQAQYSGVTAESGRAQRALRKTQELWTPETVAAEQFLKNATGKTLYQLKLEAEMGAKFDTPGKVSKFLRDMQKRSAGRAILEFFVNNLISGLATHSTYGVGNEALTAVDMGLDTPVAALIGKARELMGREGERVYASEARAKFEEHIRSLPKALQASLEAIRTGQTTLLPGQDSRALTPFEGDALPNTLQIAKTITNADVAWKEAQADVFGLVRGIKDGAMAQGTLIGEGVKGAPLIGLNYSPLGQIPNLAIRGATVLPVGSLVRTPSRAVAAIHSFFHTANYSIENNAKAWRQATSEGLTGTARNARVAQIRQNPTEESMMKSRGHADEQTLMQSGHELVSRISRVMNWAPNLPLLGETPVLKFIDPFVHIAANIIDQTIVHRTPVGMLSNEIRADILGRNGNVAQDTAQAKMLVGTSLALMFGGLASQGLMTGSGPIDPNKAMMWRLAGYQAHSIRIGDLFYDVHRLGPMGMLAGISADLYDVAHAAPKEGMLTAGSMLIHAFAQNILDESFMRGPAEWLQAIEDPGRYGPRVIQNFASSFVPFSSLLSQTDRATDPYTRMARTTMDAIKQKIPGQSETLFPRRDVWGEPTPNHEALVASGLSAIYESRMSRDPVNQAMIQLGMGLASVPKSIRNVKLDDQQIDDFARLAGRMTKMRLDQIVRSPDWQQWPPHTRRDVIEAVVKQSREAARGVMMSKYPSIVAQATKNRQLKEADDTEGGY